MNDEEWQATGSGETNGPIISQTDSEGFILESESDGLLYPPELPTDYFFGVGFSDSDGRPISAYFSRFRYTDRDYLQQRIDS